MHEPTPRPPSNKQNEEEEEDEDEEEEEEGDDYLPASTRQYFKNKEEKFATELTPPHSSSC